MDWRRSDVAVVAAGEWGFRKDRTRAGPGRKCWLECIPTSPSLSSSLCFWLTQRKKGEYGEGEKGGLARE